MPESEHEPKQSYAFIIMVFGFITMCASNICINITGQAMTTFTADLGINMADIKILPSIFGLVYAGSGFLWGWIADKIGLRLELTIACVLCAVGLFTFGSFGNSVGTLIGFWMIAALGCGGIVYSTMPKLSATWFAPKNRSKGIMVPTLGGSVVSLALGVICPIVIQSAGWRPLYIGCAVACVVFAITTYAFIRDEPADVGQVPWGSPKGTPIMRSHKNMSEEELAAKKKADNIAFKRVLTKPLTWAVALVFVLNAFCMMSSSAYLTPAMTLVGYDLTLAGAAMSAQFAGRALGQIVAPFFSDKFMRKAVLTIAMVAHGLCWFALYIILSNGILNNTLVYLLIAGTGFFDGTVGLISVCAAESFVPSLRGTGPGVASAFGAVGRFAGPMVAGAVVVNSAPAPFLCCGSAIVLAGIVAFIVFPKTGGKYGDPMALMEDNAE